MNMSAVQEERGPRRHLNTISEKSSSFKREQEILVKILQTCLHQAQFHLNISPLQRDIILQHVWRELFILRISYWPIDISHALLQYPGLMDLIQTIKALNVDLMELSLLETLILSRPDLAIDNRERSQLGLNFESAIVRLTLYLSSSTFSSITFNSDPIHDSENKKKECVKIPHRFNQLLMTLRHLNTHQHHFQNPLNSLFHATFSKTTRRGR